MAPPTVAVHTNPRHVRDFVAGLLNLISTEDELAAVLAHEV